jgi:hypothetical protein
MKTAWLAAAALIAAFGLASVASASPRNLGGNYTVNHDTNQRRGERRANARNFIEAPADLVRTVPGIDAAAEVQNLRLQKLKLPPKRYGALACNLRDAVIVRIGNRSQKLLHTIAANRRHDAEPGQVSADRVDNGCLLADEQMARAVKHQAGLLIRRFPGNETHGRALHRLAYRFCICRAVLLPLHVGLI